ncbi:hypothetical protein V865_006294 [Kwoniella europaea PYCC6329]|uniref:Uncharacterized protein n=1 Tax=Kwoniella europaea PYCC6329 TaxID=1423913 RepID=A0AAX4KSD1_9TREE
MYTSRSFPESSSVRESFEEVFSEGSGPEDPTARMLSYEIVPQDREQVQSSLEVKSSTANADAPPSARPSDASANGSGRARRSYIGKVVHLITNGPLCSSSDSGTRDANTIYSVDKWVDVSSRSCDTVKNYIPVMNNESKRLYQESDIDRTTGIKAGATQNQVEALQDRMREKLLTACQTLNDDPSTSFWHDVWSPHSGRTFSTQTAPEIDRYGSVIEPQDYHNPQLMNYYNDNTNLEIKRTFDYEYIQKMSKASPHLASVSEASRSEPNSAVATASNPGKDQVPSTPETSHVQWRTDEEATAPGPVPASPVEERGRWTARSVFTLFY